ncbi:MAG: hypothetical protein ACH346_07045, partial [Chthoniobacterales bacterium]
MKKTLLTVLLGLFCSTLLAHAQAQTYADTNPNLGTQSAHQVTASDYCDFLNQLAKSDPSFLYDAHMSYDPYAGCIARMGRPGRYEYVVIEGRAHWPINFVNNTTKAAYISFADRLQVTGCSLKEEVASPDDWLKSNTCDVEVEIISTPTLSLALTSSSTSTSNFDYAGIVSMIALAAFGHELMIRPGGEALDENLNGGAERTELHDAANHQV